MIWSVSLLWVFQGDPAKKVQNAKAEKSNKALIPEIVE